MAAKENIHETNRQLACLWALSRAGPDFGNNIILVVGTTELHDRDVMEFGTIASITIRGKTSQGREIHVSSDQYQELRWELHPRELYERDREQLLESAGAA